MNYFHMDKNILSDFYNVSLKHGKHGVGPYYDLKSIIESLLTSTTHHDPIRADEEYLKIYLMPWKQIIADKEFRVFVKNNKITAISQQHLYNVNKILYKKDLSCDSNVIHDIIKQWIDIIYKYFESVIKKKITHINSYTMDICILENNEPYFIEVNSFGKEYASGSSLYHWLIDKDILYGNNNTIYFRYVDSLTGNIIH